MVGKFGRTEGIVIMKRFIFTLSCDDRPGIVASLTTELFGLGANIAESSQYMDPDSNQFFMRLVFDTPDAMGREEIERVLKPAADRFSMRTTLNDGAVRPRLLLMVSRFDHALLHLLYQIRRGWLQADVAAIVSNHEDARRIAESENVPFHYLPLEKGRKAEQEAQLIGIVQKASPDLVVLARYMQILSDQLSTRLFGKVINIHHSFLPSFKGAKPYHQAHERGVKMIGATAHYVTSDLDEGPIIEQETVRANHAMSADDMVAIGRDIESRVLATAVKLHLEARVMLNGKKTVVFA